MKKIGLFVALLLSFQLIDAGTKYPLVDLSGDIPPTYTTGTSVTGTSATIPSAGKGQSNCLTDWTLMSSTIANMIIKDGSLASGATIWGLLAVPASLPVGEESILETPLCGSTSTQMVVFVSSGTVSINFRGTIRKFN